MSNYAKGANKEREFKALLERMDKRPRLVIRSAGSHGPVDIIQVEAAQMCASSGHIEVPAKVTLFQVKAGGSKLSEEDAIELHGLSEGLKVKAFLVQYVTGLKTPRIFEITSKWMEDTYGP